MRTLTWNCNMRFKELAAKVADLDADIVCIQECEELPRDAFDGFEFHWVGNNKNKGLAVLTKGSSKFLEDIYRPNFVYFLPVAQEDLLVLGVWAFNGRAKKFSAESSGNFLDAIDHYRATIQSFRKVVVLGDFNNGPQWDKPGHRNNFEGINAALNHLGLVSAYHLSRKEDFGKEKLATYFHHKKSDNGFHIDYIYSNFGTPLKVDVGLFSEWSQSSDHVPLSAQFDL